MNEQREILTVGGNEAVGGPSLARAEARLVLAPQFIERQLRRFLLCVVVVESRAHGARDLEVTASLDRLAQSAHVGRLHQLQRVALGELALGAGIETHTAHELGRVLANTFGEPVEELRGSYAARCVIDLDHDAEETHSGQALPELTERCHAGRRLGQQLLELALE